MSYRTSTATSSYRYNLDLNDESSFHSVDSVLTVEQSDHLSKNDLRDSLTSLSNMVNAARTFREKMVQLSEAAADFGYALERMAKTKSASETGQGLQCSAGLQFLISNQHQVLGDLFKNSFEIPLRESLDHHQEIIKQSQDNYQEALTIMSKKIRETEAKNFKNGQKRQRDIHQFRKALHDLTRQVNTVDQIQEEYYRHMEDIETKHHQMILGKVSLIVGAQLDVYEKISNKGLADPILELMIEQNPDPYCAYSVATDETTEIFTVLPPISLIDGGPTTPGGMAEYSVDYLENPNSIKQYEDNNTATAASATATVAAGTANTISRSSSSSDLVENSNDTNNNSSNTIVQQPLRSSASTSSSLSSPSIIQKIISNGSSVPTALITTSTAESVSNDDSSGSIIPQRVGPGLLTNTIDLLHSNPNQEIQKENNLLPCNLGCDSIKSCNT